jgi:hypothetical protein
VCERERERQRQRESVCVCLCVCVNIIYIHIHMYVELNNYLSSRTKFKRTHKEHISTHKNTFKKLIEGTHKHT